MDPSFIHAWLCNAMHWWFGKQSFTEFPISSKQWYLHYTLYIQKNPHRVISLLTSRGNSLGIGQLSSLPWPIPVFQVFAWNFSCFETLSFYHLSVLSTDKPRQLFCLRWCAHSVHFQENACQTPIILSSANGIPWKKQKCWDFPGGPLVKTPRFQCRGHGFNHWLGN